MADDFGALLHESSAALDRDKHAAGGIKYAVGVAAAKSLRLRYIDHHGRHMGSRRAAAAAAAAASCCRVGGDRPNAGLVGLGLTTVCGGPRLDELRATGLSVGEAAAMAAKWSVVAVSQAAVPPAGHGFARTVAAAADGGGVSGVWSGGCGGVRSSLAAAAARLSVAAIAAAAAAVAAAAAAGS